MFCLSRLFRILNGRLCVLTKQYILRIMGLLCKNQNGRFRGDPDSPSCCVPVWNLISHVIWIRKDALLYRPTGWGISSILYPTHSWDSWRDVRHSKYCCPGYSTLISFLFSSAEVFRETKISILANLRTKDSKLRPSTATPCTAPRLPPSSPPPTPWGFSQQTTYILTKVQHFKQ